MAKYAWGGYCPDSLKFSFKNYHKKHCTLWQAKFYTSWCTHGRRGTVDPKFMDFSAAYDWLIHDYPLFDQYLKVCELEEKGLLTESYSWEKDGSGTHLFGPSLQFMPQKLNMRQAMLDNPDMHHKMALSQGKPVIGISPSGETFEWFGANEAARQLSANAATIGNKCKDGSAVTYGNLKGWRFYYK